MLLNVFLSKDILEKRTRRCQYYRFIFLFNLSGSWLSYVCLYIILMKIYQIHLRNNLNNVTSAVIRSCTAAFDVSSDTPYTLQNYRAVIVLYIHHRIIFQQRAHMSHAHTFIKKKSFLYFLQKYLQLSDCFLY